MTPDVRVTLALYCYQRAHLHSIGLAIAASCEEDDLTRRGGKAGEMLFARFREAPRPPHLTPRLGRRQITLARGPLRLNVPVDDETDERRTTKRYPTRPTSSASLCRAASGQLTDARSEDLAGPAPALPAVWERVADSLLGSAGLGVGGVTGSFAMDGNGRSYVPKSSLLCPRLCLSQRPTPRVEGPPPLQRARRCSFIRGDNVRKDMCAHDA